MKDGLTELSNRGPSPIPHNHHPRHESPCLGSPHRHSLPLKSHREPSCFCQRSPCLQLRKQNSRHSQSHSARRVPLSAHRRLSIPNYKRQHHHTQCSQRFRHRNGRRSVSPNPPLCKTRPQPKRTNPLSSSFKYLSPHRRRQRLPSLPPHIRGPPLLSLHAPHNYHTRLSLSNPDNLYSRRPHPCTNLHKQAIPPPLLRLLCPRKRRPRKPRRKRRHRARHPSSPSIAHPDPLCQRRSSGSVHSPYELHLRIPAPRYPDRYLQDRWGHRVPAASIRRHARHIH